MPLLFVAATLSGKTTMKHSASLYCAILLSFGAATPLQAQMHYPTNLINELGGHSISATTTKCVILIHGWNPDANPNCYSGPEWSSLLTNLKARLNGSGWGVVAYDWHEDAATGSVWNFLLTDFFDLAVASTAAFNAQTHGFHLASQLNQLSPNLREVHFIAHSAGSWAASSAAQQLLQLNPYVVVQVTLLDPFVPDPSGLLYGGDFSDSAMNGMQSFSGNDRIQRLENYYANDSPEHGWNPAPWGDLTGPTYNTQETFALRSGIDINQEVDWGTTIIGTPPYSPNYDWHAGPIQFYSDCVNANLFPTSIPSALQGTGCPFDYRQIGWNRSLYAWESLLPQITVQPANQSAQTGGSATFTVSASQATAYEWYKVGGGYIGSGSSLTLNNVSSGNAGSYVVRVSNANGQLYSQSATLTITTTGNVGSLTVDLSPAGAVSAGAQWRVDGGSYYNSGETVTSLTPGSHTVSFKTVTGYTTPADKIVAITSGVNTPDSGTYVVIITWTGVAFDNNWYNRTNWNPKIVPTSSDNVIVNSGTVNVPTNFVFQSLTFTGGTLNNPFTINGTMNWTGGTISGPGALNVAAGSVLNLTSASTKYLNTTINNAGTLLFGGTGYLNAGSAGAVINNLAGGVFNHQSDASINDWNGNPNLTINNAGTYLKSGGIGTSVFQNVRFTNSGSAQFNGGAVMEFRYGVFNNTGSVNVQSGELLFSETTAIGAATPLNAAPGASVGVAVSWNGYTVTLTTNLTVNGTMNWHYGTISGPGALNVAAGSVLNLASDSTKYLNTTISNAGTLLFGGTGYLNAGSAGAVINNLAGGVFNHQSDASNND